eukprot:gene9140-11217_t
MCKLEVDSKGHAGCRYNTTLLRLFNRSKWALPLPPGEKPRKKKAPYKRDHIIMHRTPTTA